MRRHRVWNKYRERVVLNREDRQKTLLTYLLTSSADCAIKNPWVLATILAPRGLIEILVSAPSVPLTSIARRRSLSLVKHNLLVRIMLTNVINHCKKYLTNAHSSCNMHSKEERRKRRKQAQLASTKLFCTVNFALY